MSWIPLNAHSQYSILNSTASCARLAKKAKEYGMTKLALTDYGNLYGAVDFYKSCTQQGVSPILGCEIWVAPESLSEKKRIVGVPNGFPIVLLAKNEQGYRNLCVLSSKGFLEGFYYQPRIDRALLEKYREGLICLSGPVRGPLGYWILNEDQEKTKEALSWYQNIFQDDFYLQIERYPYRDTFSEGWLEQKVKEFTEEQTKVNEALIAFSKERSIELVATHAICYLEKEDWQAHEILLNVLSGEPCEIWERDSYGNPKNKILNPKRDTAKTRELYFPSQEEMRERFSDLPQALENTLKIAEKCQLELDFHTKRYPVFMPPSCIGKEIPKEERLKAAEHFLRELCEEGIRSRYTEETLGQVQKNYPNQEPLTVVRERFEMEFSILTSKGMSDYMLIVYDFINWAKQKGIPMGPGRGSAAGSLISYLIGITDIEPLRFHLFFERFINPERVSYPDIDVDICMERRQEVIDYVVEKYGKDKVAQIITFGTMKAKMAIRDVGRVLSVPLSKVNQIASLVPEDPGMTLEKALQSDAELRTLIEQDPEAARVLEMAQKAEGSIRNTSTHAAGLIISAEPITDHVPVCTAKDSEMVVTQYAMKPVESVGMLKIDFLGLKTLTCIQKCVEAIEKTQQKRLSWETLPLDDQRTFSLLNQGKTLGVFQLESGGMQELIKQLHIDAFEEIIAVCALYRPGPMDMIPSFIQRKHGKEAIEIDHPLMETILKETNGVMVYQEQVMQIASALAGYSLGEGDVLRRAMGKKDKEEMARQRKKFIEGAKEKEISADLAGHIFDKIEKFASYGFNKSHAAAYGYLSYVTAYMKANYPKEWMAALMTCDRDDITKAAKFIGEAKAMHISVLPPDINESADVFMPSSQGIRLAMSGIKGVGQGVVALILAERKVKGAFRSLYDFMQRIDKTKVGKKQIEILCQAGCFDFTLWSRDALTLSVEESFQKTLKEQKESSLGVLNLFSLIEEEKEPHLEPPVVPNPTSPLEQLQREKELLGFYLTGHPMDSFRSVIQRLSCIPLSEIENLSEGTLFRVTFVVEKAQFKVSSKSQRKFAILTISDGEERFEVPVWPELYDQTASLLYENHLLYGILQADRREGSLSLSCKALEALSEIDETKATELEKKFDQIQAQQRPKNYTRKKPMKPKEEEKTVHYTLRLSADQTQLSTLLQFKELFRAHPGKSTLELVFCSLKGPVGTVFIDQEWGVKKEAIFDRKLKELASSFHVEVSQS